MNIATKKFASIAAAAAFAFAGFASAASAAEFRTPEDNGGGFQVGDVATPGGGDSAGLVRHCDRVQLPDLQVRGRPRTLERNGP